ncbi:sensor histidine kinase [Neobacillus drentensis]|uniref:sensor histidine kinase n=1 Tax=Neobacillus drentensis TaxID=220684 RepID=UPI001F1A7F69|nr:sensor histidine kinase [Neobacillus drentensis]ULT54591.1 sensor histidine kinase [Neobacillus drentensis]
MTFKQYLSDQKWLLVTFAILLVIISVLISVDPNLEVTVNSLLYLVVLAGIFITVYFIGSYFFKKQQLKRWKEFNMTQAASLTKASTHEEITYIQAIQQVNETYLQQIHEMKEASKEQLEFMTHWFHEIKTPIAVSRLLLETEIESASLQEEISRIESYVEQALYFSRLHEFNKDYLIQEVSLEKLIKQIIAAESKAFIAKRIKVMVPNTSMTVLSDKKALSYIIRQLLLNSLKYTLEQGEITFSVNRETKQLLLADNGIGIPAEDLPRVFDKGFTGKNGRTSPHSTGMGLFLAKKTAEKLGHELILSSKPNVGTEAVISFGTQPDDYFSI